MRYLLLEAVNKQGASFWILINRKYDMYMVKAAPDDGKIIHAGEAAQNGLLIRNLFDGELVNDKEWRSKNVYAGDKPKPIFLVFDAILVNKNNEMASPFRTRLIQADKYLKKRFTAARMRLKKQNGQEPSCPNEIDVYMKEMFEVWDAPKILTNIISKEKDKLQHENDGLIFTIDACPYYPGTCTQIAKWKPPELNTIDFLVGKEVCTNIFALHSMIDAKDSVVFDFLVLEKTMEVKKGQVLECAWDLDQDTPDTKRIRGLYEQFEQEDEDSRQNISKRVQASLEKGEASRKKSTLTGGWTILRERGDKAANHLRVAENILKTIENPID